MSDAPALKEIFNVERIRHIAQESRAVCPAFDEKRFLQSMLTDLDELSLMARLHKLAEHLHFSLPGGYLENLDILKLLAPRLNKGFVTLILPEYVAIYGGEHFDASLQALKFFTPFGSSEFAVRHFLKQDLERTLKTMQEWSRDSNEHVRRLASEGSRPRLPWSFNLRPLMLDPGPVGPILDNLRADPSLYVRKSVANHLNDITKDNPAWTLDRLSRWELAHKHTAWIAKQALRTLVKKGDPGALDLLGATRGAQVALQNLQVLPAKIQLGEKIELSFELCSMATTQQHLVVDYNIHYLKKFGAPSAKVFKLKTVDLPPQASLSFRRSRQIKDFTTRVHYPGRHQIEILVNGQVLGQTSFELTRDGPGQTSSANN